MLYTGKESNLEKGRWQGRLQKKRAVSKAIYEAQGAQEVQRHKPSPLLYLPETWSYITQLS